MLIRYVIPLILSSFLCAQVQAATLGIYNIKRHIAIELAKASADQNLSEYLDAQSTVLSSKALSTLIPSVTQQLNEANRGIAQVKEYERDVDLLQIRLADESMLDELAAGILPLFAIEPSGSDKYWTVVEAFDHLGERHLLSAKNVPKRPVFVVELDAAKDMRAGLAIMQAIFSAYDTPAPLLKQHHDLAALDTSVLRQIRINDVQESWISGNAEIYAMVSGIDSDETKAKLSIVDMPYLDDEDRTYYPNQVVIYWDRYRYQAADIVFMEQDDGMNYGELARRLLGLAESYLRSIGKIEFASIAQLTSQLIAAMPDSWFTNDDDFVDVLYTLRKNRFYTNRYGASANVKATLAPLSIPEN